MIFVFSAGHTHTGNVCERLFKCLLEIDSSAFRHLWMSDIVSTKQNVFSSKCTLFMFFHLTKVELLIVNIVDSSV